MNKRKKIILTVLFGGMSLAALAGAMGLLHHGNFLFFVLFPLSGLFGNFAEHPFHPHIKWGLAIPIIVLAVFLPFVFLLPIVVYIGAFLALLIFAGWALGRIPRMIAERIPAEQKNSRIERRIRFSVLLTIVLLFLFGVWNCVFGNPITAMIAGEEMKDWISAEADKGILYEIRGDSLPRYDVWGMSYCFDLAIPAEHRRAELRWKKGEIRLTDGNW